MTVNKLLDQREKFSRVGLPQLIWFGLMGPYIEKLRENNKSSLIKCGETSAWPRICEIGPMDASDPCRGELNQQLH